jgi:hypothetical protein
MRKLEVFYFKTYDIKFGFKSIKLVEWYLIYNQFLINKDKNRGMFLFTIPYPPPDRSNVYGSILHTWSSFSGYRRGRFLRLGL